MAGKHHSYAMAAILSALIGVAACASSQNSDFNKPQPEAGGYAGSTGTGGSSATGGSGGTGGTSFGGTGGASGSAGTGGSAGIDGGAGSPATGGSAGNAGAGGIDGGAGSPATGGSAGNAGAGGIDGGAGSSTGGSAGSSTGGSAGSNSDAGAPGPENSCPGSAITLSGSGTSPRTGSISGNNTNLADDADGSCTLNSGGSDAVYSLTPDIAGAVSITLTSDFNASLYVRTTCGNAGSEVACDNETGFAIDSVTFSAQANTTYYVFVDGSETGQVGSFQLDVTVTPTGPEDTCPGTSVSFTSSGSQETATVHGNTSADTDSTSGSCVGTNQNDAVYAFTPDISGVMDVTLQAPDFDSGLYVRTTCASTSTEVACSDNGAFGDDESVSFQATAGKTYYVFVDGFDDGADDDNGSFTLTAAIGQAGPEDVCPGASVSFTSSGSGETATVHGDTTFDSDSTSGSCVGSNEHDAVYAFTPDISGTMDVDLKAPGFDSGLYARTTCASTSTELACSDNGAFGDDETMTFSVTAGATYYVFVDAYSGSGTFTLTADVAP
jgi:hypothetical protein